MPHSSFDKILADHKHPFKNVQFEFVSKTMLLIEVLRWCKRIGDM